MGILKDLCDARAARVSACEELAGQDRARDEYARLREEIRLLNEENAALLETIRQLKAMNGQ